MNVLKIQHLSKRFGNTEVLKDISISVDEGEVVSIIGPSGSGKSTLLRCATFLEKMDGGSLSYGGLQVVQDSVYSSPQVLREARARFGLVFQNFNLFPHFSILKNITAAQTSVLKRTKEEATDHAMALLHKMGLQNKAKAYPCELSGGQQQRVSIARALALDPDIIFFDEPTSALDPELTGEILKVIRSLAEEHMTMVIVTHEMSFARDVSDRAIFMDNGLVVEDGPADELIDNPKNQRTKTFLARFSQVFSSSKQ